MSGITFEGLKREIEKRPCVACGRVPGRLDYINGVNLSGIVNPKEVWPLCESHKREKDQFGLCQLLKWYPSALREYERLGFPESETRKKAREASGVTVTF